MAERRTLLYLITRPDPAGAGYHLRDLMVAMRDRFTLHLGVGEEGFLTERARLAGAQVHLVPSMVRPLRPGRDLATIRAVRRLIRKVKPNLVHAHTFKAGMVGRIAAAAQGIPSVFTPHAWSFLPGTPVAWQLVATPIEAALARLGDEVVCVSRDELEQARRRRVVPRGKGVVIHNGLPDNEHRANPGEDRESVTIIMVARFMPQKNHDALLEALAPIDMSYELWLVGDGPRRPAIEARVADLGMSARVRFLGMRQDVPKLLAASHILALTSHWEGMPLVVLEAMRAGLPVVAADVGGVSEAVVHAESGLLTPRGDGDLLHDHLRTLIGNPQLRRRLGSAGRRLFEEKFQLARQVNETLAVYERLIATSLTEYSVEKKRNHPLIRRVRAAQRTRKNQLDRSGGVPPKLPR